MEMDRMLVGLDLRKGLVDSIIIKKGMTIDYQPLEYEGIHFKCGRCYVYENMEKECPLPNK